jgi:hypothetical protein
MVVAFVLDASIAREDFKGMRPAWLVKLAGSLQYRVLRLVCGCRGCERPTGQLLRIREFFVLQSPVYLPLCATMHALGVTAVKFEASYEVNLGQA